MANSLVGRILLARSIHTEEIKTALAQAWKTIKEVKVETLGNNMFLFKFGLEIDNRKVMAGRTVAFR